LAAGHEPFSAEVANSQRVKKNVWSLGTKEQKKWALKLFKIKRD